jgi:hypothetical protein
MLAGIAHACSNSVDDDQQGVVDPGVYPLPAPVPQCNRYQIQRVNTGIPRRAGRLTTLLTIFWATLLKSSEPCKHTVSP